MNEIERNYNKIFSQCFRNLRETHDLTQGELAEEIGISRQSVNALEKGKSLPSFELAIEIANFFNTTLDEMIELDRQINKNIKNILTNKVPRLEQGKESKMTNLSPWRPLGEAMTLREAMDKLFEDSVITSGNLPNTKFANAMPSVDMYEDDKDVVAEVHMAGYKEDDINLEVDDEAIYISGEKKASKEDKKKNYFRKEVAYGKFSRTIAFPVEVKSEKAQADFKDGVLTITVPKEKPKKKKTLKLKVKKAK